MTLRICHLYGNLMNTYGDNGNLLMLQYLAKEKGETVETDLVSLNDPFDPEAYDLVFFGGGQDYEQSLVAKDIQKKKAPLTQYIESGGVVVAICGGFQLLGHYYINAQHQRLEGLGAIDYYTETEANRLIGDIEIYNDRFDLSLKGYENHAGRTYLGPGVQALGQVQSGFGNNGQDQTEGCLYKNTFCSYFHGPLLVRNPQLTDIIIDLARSGK
ncbi:MULTISPECIES: type 1 glutamine amidotransferase [Aerococcus]|uniref:Lipid II isoglutaminyl synthase (glutamine-hydrolyzing) subunit GatD n=1 Tax=Aerococcus sanguinicola TaxID=119206 RepID=A0A5N1GN57_9LACT|nr:MULTISPECIES: adenosylcobyric acid synthase [Aerococcus]KAA9301756.1 adenosylcobyric acid synthase [Aerococcus sanguinicola]MDK6368828.1 adenosylcobyric acid synthase [Aerococcus sp. UMB9870]MDK6685729.1 adenosylcobyric acid synthase [Aerococcus sp. UMB8623]MDK6939452.1 adenosylcobyric acid synthase [Aerococcus sp. UMB8487]OFK19632.1 adenosylcobyric acid synthase [Aerococcus sp. HMSC072A12]